MSKIPFKVSAKAARLIGRENVANAEGALVELVKNTYDADASTCVLAILPRFSGIPDTLSKEEFAWLLTRSEEIDEIYELGDDGNFAIKPEQKDSPLLRDLISEFLKIVILDNGTGMSSRTVVDSWMTIGTNFKEVNAVSDKGRVRTGAKGIGRFALDRLGANTKMRSTSYNGGTRETIDWVVNWDDFEGSGKVLGDVNAELETVDAPLEALVDSLKVYPPLRRELNRTRKTSSSIPPWGTGTLIEINFLRDEWRQNDAKHLYKALSALLPPIKQRDFRIYLFDYRAPTNYGAIAPQLATDFDYSLTAEVSSDGRVNFSIERHELDHTALPAALFERADMKPERYNKEAFAKTAVEFVLSFQELFVNADEKFLVDLKSVGPFKFNLLFFKRQLPNVEDRKRYPYRNFDPAARKTWLDQFAGIKIYRDGFVVRPYGEADGKMFDWLSLGHRVAQNPAPASRLGWAANPQNLVGTIEISRIENSALLDQSNREGIIENEAYAAFRQLILRIIKEFEDDRSTILSNIRELDRATDRSSERKALGLTTADRVRLSPQKATPEDARILAVAYKEQQEELKDARDEGAMLRSLATLGTVLVSFSHEMGQLRRSIGSRANEMEGILKVILPPDILEGLDPDFDPFILLADWKEDNEKVRQWFNFALTTVRADRRRRRNVAVSDYLETIKQRWDGFLLPRAVSLSLSIEDDFRPKIRALEIDLDSIFNNLIINSVEAMLAAAKGTPRGILIRVEREGLERMRVIYTDTGPGLTRKIKDPRQIFSFSVTSKWNADETEAGTGLGMWILDTIVREYNGYARAFHTQPGEGFRLELSLPIQRN